MTVMLVVDRRIRVSRDEFRFSYARSSGPGGQNVNKVNTKVTLHWPVHDSGSLPEDVRQRFVERYGRRINSEGELVVSSQRYRDQARNIEDCLAKVRAMLSSVARPPKVRKPTRPTRASRQRRLDEKRRAGQKKQLRRPPSD